MKSKQNIYLDYSAAAPEIEAARYARRQAEKFFGNAGSIHHDGLQAAKVLEQSRNQIATLLNAHSDEIIFASTGTESDNLAILGAFSKAKDNHAGHHIITLTTEHPAVKERYNNLKKVGAVVTYIPVKSDGLIDMKEFTKALNDDTAIISIMYANNEIGVVQPIREIMKEVRRFRKNKTQNKNYPLVHTDACQASQFLNMNVEQLGIDLMSFSGVKLGGGHGASILYIRRGTPIAPMFFGGEQENGLRPGTENVPAIAALAVAFAEARKISEKESKRLMLLRDFCFSEIRKHFDEARINGSLENRLPNNINVSFPDIDSELLVLELDAKGISVSAGSACGSAKNKSSHVIQALYGVDDAKKYGTIRISLGKETNKKEISLLITALKNIFAKYKRLI